MQRSTQETSRSVLFHGCAAFVLGLAVAFATARPIDLVTADLGRHIANGFWLWEEGRWEILTQNFYSYTEPTWPFTNHHWLGGLIFYFVHQVAGFAGLGLLWISLVGLSFALMAFQVLRQHHGFRSWMILILAIPLASARTEVRPEGFSVLFAATFIVILSNYCAGRCHKGWLAALPVIMALWVNVHIYFVFGLGIVAAFFVEAAIRMRKPSADYHSTREAVLAVGSALAATTLATLANPFGIKLALYPLKIFDNYGYMVVENQSIYFLLNYGMHLPVFPPALAAMALLVLGVLGLVRKDAKAALRADLAIAVVFAVLAALALRNMSGFGILALPAMGMLWQPWHSHKVATKRLRDALLAALVAAGLVGYWRWGGRWGVGQQGLGLIGGINQAANFYKEAGIKGPIFNNYDIGGYLIYHFSTTQPVFVDNRPEAYSADFLQHTYVKMQEDNAFWQTESERLGINSVFFYWHDATPAGQKFLTTRVRDPDWVPVYVDDRCLIFVKNAPLNQSVIERFAIPRERFNVR